MEYLDLLVQYLSQIDQAMFVVPAVILNTRVIPMTYLTNRHRPVITAYGKSAIPASLAKHVKFLDEVEDGKMIYLILSELLKELMKEKILSMDTDELLWQLAAMSVWDRVIVYATLAGKSDFKTHATIHETIAKAGAGVKDIVSLDPQRIEFELWEEYRGLLQTPGWKEKMEAEARKTFPHDNDTVTKISSALIWEHAMINVIVDEARKHFQDKGDRLQFMLRCKDGIFGNSFPD